MPIAGATDAFQNKISTRQLVALWSLFSKSRELNAGEARKAVHNYLGEDVYNIHI